jgi:hypothetical protein
VKIRARTSWGDYDNDGFLDLFVSQGYFEPEPHTNLLYHNNGNANAWLNVKLVGTRSNRSAIGAKVRVKAFYRGASRWQLREISGGDSGANQQSLNAEFGLADATIVDTLRVEWPSGAVTELHDVAPRQHLTITEPGDRPTCGDGIDNDGDGLVDFVDPKCQPSWPYWETLPCGLGAELALLLPLLGRGRRILSRSR